MIASVENKTKNTLAYSLLFLLFTYLSPPAHSQTGPSATLGFGNYELINIGLQYQISRTSLFAITGGSNLKINNATAWSAGLSFKQVFPKPLVWGLQPGYSIGANFWTNDDDLYYFENISFPLNVLFVYPINSSFSILAENGLILTKIITSERKQNVTTGFPNRTNYNFSVKLIYRFHRNAKE